MSRRTGCEIIKAIRVRSRADVQASRAFRVAYHLLDAHHEGKRGGTGETFDWEFLAGRRSKAQLILAGGLRPDNVAAGIAAVHPFAVDVASGVEVSPGVKDHALMAAFSAAANSGAVAREAVRG